MDSLLSWWLIKLPSEQDERHNQTLPFEAETDFSAFDSIPRPFKHSSSQLFIRAEGQLQMQNAGAQIPKAIRPFRLMAINKSAKTELQFRLVFSN
jgi:hypothetical protein